MIIELPRSFIMNSPINTKGAFVENGMLKIGTVFPESNDRNYLPNQRKKSLLLLRKNNSGRGDDN